MGVEGSISQVVGVEVAGAAAVAGAAVEEGAVV